MPWQLKTILWPIHVWISCSTAFLAEYVNMSLFISDMAQMAEQKSDCAKA